MVFLMYSIGFLIGLLIVLVFPLVCIGCLRFSIGFLILIVSIVYLLIPHVFKCFPYIFYCFSIVSLLFRYLFNMFPHLSIAFLTNRQRGSEGHLHASRRGGPAPPNRHPLVEYLDASRRGGAKPPHWSPGARCH